MKRKKHLQIGLCWILAVLIVMAAGSACRPNEEIEPDTGASSGEPEETVWNLVKDGKSDYVIVVDLSNEADTAYAKALQLKLYSLCGVTLPLRNATADTGSAPLILVGMTGKSESTALYKAMQEDDFSCRITGNGWLVLGAASAQDYTRLDVILEEYLSSGKNENGIILPERLDFLFSRDCPDGVFGTSAEILKNGESDYVLVYPLGGSTSRSAAVAVADYIEDVAGIRFPVKSENSTNAKEILLGETTRPASGAVMKQLNATGDYGICVSGNSLVLAGYDGIGLTYAVQRFAEMLRDSSGSFTLYQSGNMLSPCEREPYPVDLKECVNLYHEMYGTYGSYIAMRYATLSEADKADQACIEALIDRMGESVAFYIGSSTALYRGFYTKLDPADYRRAAVAQNGRLLIPSTFAVQYFGADCMDGGSEEWFDLTAYCLQNSGWELYQSGNVVVCAPSSVASFSDPAAKVGNYTNAGYLKKMEELFTNPTRREPENATEQTRVVIEETLYDATGVWDYTKNPYRTNYSPGICAVTENGAEVLYASYESCLVQNFQTEIGNVTHLKRSIDGGASWKEVGAVEGMRWACIFELNGCIYLLGTHVSGSLAMVARYDPALNDFTFSQLGIVGGVGAPCSVLIANGRIYKASGSRVMSASTESDLLAAESWRFSSVSAEQLLTKEWFRKESGVGDFNGYALGEGSVVQGPDGGIYMILRIDSDPYCGYAAIARVSEDGSTVSVVEECNSLLRLPTSISKFSVRYDAVSGLYLSMTSLPTLPQNAAKQRNILALVASRDLIHWEIVDTLLVDREMMNATLSAAAHAFQYVDFVVSGDHLRLIVREATGFTNTYHDGKYITMYTVYDFRTLIGDRCPELTGTEELADGKTK